MNSSISNPQIILCLNYLIPKPQLSIFGLFFSHEVNLSSSKFNDQVDTIKLKSIEQEKILEVINLP